MVLKLVLLSGHKNCAIFTAYNPRSILTDETQNEELRRKLIKDVEEKGWEHYDSLGDRYYYYCSSTQMVYFMRAECRKG
jgi:hypothetical protein